MPYADNTQRIDNRKPHCITGRINFAAMSSESAERLKVARKRAGYATASAAAEAFGWQKPGYTHHENGTREYFDASNLVRYARAFRVSPAWLAGVDADMTDSLDAISSESFGEVMSGILQAFAPTVRFERAEVDMLGRALRDTLREMLTDAATGNDAARSGLVARTIARTLARQN